MPQRMRIGLNGGANWTRLEDILEQARGAARDGFPSYWLSQGTGPDVLTAFALIGRELPEIELGASVIPTYPRHPMVLASQALTTQAAIGGRLILGIGPSHRVIVEEGWGYSFDHPFSHTREYVAALKPLLAGETVEQAGRFVTARGMATVEAPAPKLILGALGPKMLELAGREMDGIVTWMVGPKTLRAHSVPGVSNAAERAGRPAPRIIAGIMACVTSTPDEARAAARKKLEFYRNLPSYRRMLDREGVAEPWDLLVAGNEDEVQSRIEEFEAAGATDARVAEFCPDPESKRRTRALLVSMIRERA